MLINRQDLGYRILAIIFIACLFGHQPGVNAQPQKKQVRLQLRWHHQFQFAGYYVALEQGFYRKAGLDVTLIEGGPNQPYVIEQVLNSKAEFGVSTSGLVLEYLRGKPVITLATIFQKSPTIWLMRAESKIKSPSDFVGKSVSLFEDSTELKAMFVYDGIPLNKIQFQQNGEGLKELIAGSQSAIEAYVTNEPFTLKQKDIKYRLLQPIDYGIDFYGDTLFTRQQFLDDNPNTVQDFVEASLKGWEYAFKHQEEIIQLIHQRYAPLKSLEHLRYEAEEMRKLILPDLIELGHINQNRWQFIAKTYKKVGLTDQDSDLKDFIYQPRVLAYYQKYIVPGILLAIFGIVGWLVVGWYINMNRRLKSALKEIKTLQGIIPICSYCHSILDDEGDWRELEAYIHKNSDATFSHGICPKCVPGVMKEISDDSNFF